MSTMKPPKPADFTGEERDSETVDMFFHQLGIYLHLSNVADADKTDIASMFLKGRAYRWFMTKQASPEAAESIADFANFKKELRTFFIPPRRRIGAHQTFLCNCTRSFRVCCRLRLGASHHCRQNRPRYLRKTPQTSIH